ncbi:FDLD family class I lanthipeptide [Paenibacillus durus]
MADKNIFELDIQVLKSSSKVEPRTDTVYCTQGCPTATLCNSCYLCW